MALTDDAIDKIKAMIMSGEFPSGSRLPKEDDLALRLGLSRSSLREAVRALTAMQILVTRQGDGTYVSSLEPHLLMETLSFASDVSRDQTALQLLQVRRMLEPQAVALAAGRIGQTELKLLDEILVCSEAADSPEEFVRLDIRFHNLIVDVIGNPVLSMLLQVVSTKTQRMRILRGAQVHEALKQSRREHRAILGALVAHDAPMAAAAAAVHVSGLETWLAGSP